jgi:oxygen-dependent protoporphyrinogen oxidase
MADKRRAVVIGGGISGLVCAHRLKTLGIDVTLLESSAGPGGVAKTERIGEFLIERGPNSCRGTLELLDLVDELGLQSQLVEGDPKAPAFIYYNGELHPVPMGPASLLKTKLLSFWGKLRLLAEPLKRGRASDREESLASFASRRLGKQVAGRLLAPFVSGIYAGDAERLSIQACFPAVTDLERKHGSIVRGALKEARIVKAEGKKPARKAKRTCSFVEGMGQLPQTLASGLGESFVASCENVVFEEYQARDSATVDSRFKIAFERKEGVTEILCDDIVIATPAWVAADLLRHLNTELPSLLLSIEYPPLTVLYLAYDESSLALPLTGFGFLAVPGELEILGCIFNSSMFEGRAPEGKGLLTVFVGGAREPRLAGLGDDELFSLVRRDLQVALPATGVPHLVGVTRYQRSIPQYNLGHRARIQKIERLTAQIPGLTLIGNYLHGVSTGDCLIEADKVARQIAASSDPRAGKRPETLAESFVDR